MTSPSIFVTMISNAGDKTKAWYAVHTRSRFEKTVHSRLCAQDVESFLPLYASRRRWSDRTVELDLPLFPCYLFVNVSLEFKEHYCVLNTRGVVKILGNGKEFTPVRDDEIACIKHVLSAKVPVTSLPWLQEGKTVEVAAGPLCGTKGVIQVHAPRGRLFILVESLGQTIAADIDWRDVRATT